MKLPLFEYSPQPIRRLAHQLEAARLPLMREDAHTAVLKKSLKDLRVTHHPAAGGTAWSTAFLGPVEVELEGPPLSVRGKTAALAGAADPAPERARPDRAAADRGPLGRQGASTTAANTLQVYASQLRKIVATACRGKGRAYRLRIDPDELDAERFERLAEEGDAVLRRRSVSRGRRAARRGALPLAPGLRSPTCATSRPPRARSRASRSWRLVANENRIEADARARAPRPGDRRARSADREQPRRRERLRSLQTCSRSTGQAGRRTRSTPTRLPGQTLLDDARAWSPGLSSRSSSRRSSARTRRSRTTAAPEQRPRARQHAARRPQTRAR